MRYNRKSSSKEFKLKRREENVTAQLSPAIIWSILCCRSVIVIACSLYNVNIITVRLHWKNETAGIRTVDELFRCVPCRHSFLLPTWGYVRHLFLFHVIAPLELRQRSLPKEKGGMGELRNKHQTMHDTKAEHAWNASTTVFANCRLVTKWCLIWTNSELSESRHYTMTQIAAMFRR